MISLDWKPGASVNTIIVSDLHLCDAEPPHPRNPLWKRFKRPRHFVDRSFSDFLEHVQRKLIRNDGAVPIELVLNGDIFDFDSVMQAPGHFEATWLEKKRGLASEEEKSRYKLSVILRDHAVWLSAVREFVMNGNRLVFVIGNHDMELHWPSVQQDFLRALDLPKDRVEAVRFCEWFYISNEDTLIEHGNQYDAYCLASNPIHPLIRKGSKVYVRLPFGNLAGKYMLNGMGLMNPHVDSSFIKSSFKEYFVFYYRYMMRTQPLLFWTWLWSAFVTLLYSLADGFLPAMRDPLTVPTRIADISSRAKATPMMVLSLRELHAHPAIFNPVKILRELWLDRALLLGLMVFGSFQAFSVMNVFVTVSVWWFIVPLAIMIPVFMSYAQSVDSEVDKTQTASFEMVPLSARIAKVSRVIHGHIHRERHSWIENIEYLNTGTWSPAFRDVECTQPFGRKCFAWIKPQGTGGRTSELYEWTDSGVELISPDVSGPIKSQ